MDIVTYALCKKNDAAIIDMITSMERLTMVVSDTVPTVETAEPNKLYLVDTNHDGIYEEYVLAEIDSVQQIVMLGDITDLSGYYTSSQVDTLLNGKEDYIQVLTQQEYDALTPAQKAEDKAYIVIIDSTHAEVYKQNRLFGTTKADHITYDHTVSGLSATDVKGAIDEVAGMVGDEHIELTQAQYDNLQNPDPDKIYMITDAVDEGDFSNLENRIQALENMDAQPTQDSAKAVTSDGIYRYTAGQREYVNNTVAGEIFNTYSGQYKNVATGDYSHAEGYHTSAIAPKSHAEGDATEAYAQASHAEGTQSHAKGVGSHAEGSNTTAWGEASHAGGYYTQATALGSTVIGKYNKIDSTSAGAQTHLFIVGNGTGTNARSNILEVSDSYMNLNGTLKINNTAIGSLAMKSSASGTVTITNGTLPSLIYDSANERLIFDAGTLPTSGTVTVS